MSLLPCPTCRRHVRDEERCPFCGTALTSSAGEASPPAPARGLRRVAMIAATAALATGAGVDCSGTVSTSSAAGTTSGGGGSAAGHTGGGSTTAGQGGPPRGGTGGRSKSSGGGTGNIAPPYGAPPF